MHRSSLALYPSLGVAGLSHDPGVSVFCGMLQMFLQELKPCFAMISPPHVLMLFGAGRGDAISLRSILRHCNAQKERPFVPLVERDHCGAGSLDQSIGLRGGLLNG